MTRAHRRWSALRPVHTRAHHTDRRPDDDPDDAAPGAREDAWLEFLCSPLAPCVLRQRWRRRREGQRHPPGVRQALDEGIAAVHCALLLVAVPHVRGMHRAAARGRASAERTLSVDSKTAPRGSCSSIAAASAGPCRCHSRSASWKSSLTPPRVSSPRTGSSCGGRGGGVSQGGSSGSGQPPQPHPAHVVLDPAEGLVAEDREEGRGGGGRHARRCSGGGSGGSGEGGSGGGSGGAPALRPPPARGSLWTEDRADG